jgi:type II secretory pathway pseudopilin PulG
MAGRLQASQQESRALRKMAQQARARARATRHQARIARAQRQTAATATLTWLMARLGTMPVIEQAKGIIMCQQRCGPEEAFDLLRRASQRSNVKVHVLAALIVKQTASSGNGDNVTPITLGTTKYSRSATSKPAGQR